MMRTTSPMLQSLFSSSHELVGFLYELPVDRVAKPALNGNGDGLVHLVARHHADTLLSEISVFPFSKKCGLKPNFKLLTPPSGFLF